MLIMTNYGVHEGPTCHSHRGSCGERHTEDLRSLGLLIKAIRNWAVCKPSARPQWQVSLCSPGGRRDGAQPLNYSSLLNQEKKKKVMGSDNYVAILKSNVRFINFSFVCSFSRVWFIYSLKPLTLPEHIP